VGIGWTDEQIEDFESADEIRLEDFQFNIEFSFEKGELFSLPGSSDAKRTFVWFMYCETTNKFHTQVLDMNFKSCDYNYYASGKNTMVSVWIYPF
jgi:hypothetical protein